MLIKIIYYYTLVGKLKIKQEIFCIGVAVCYMCEKVITDLLLLLLLWVYKMLCIGELCYLFTIFYEPHYVAYHNHTLNVLHTQK